jgi:flagellar transcriptional activator FlhC
VQGIEGGEVVLSVTRAWFLVRFFNAGMMQMVSCRQCSGHFVTHTNELHTNYVCGICHPPARAGKTNAKARQQDAQLAEQAA